MVTGLTGQRGVLAMLLVVVDTVREPEVVPTHLLNMEETIVLEVQ